MHAMAQNSARNKSQVILEVGTWLPLLALQSLRCRLFSLDGPEEASAGPQGCLGSWLAGCHSQGGRLSRPARHALHAAGGLPGHLDAWELAHPALGTEAAGPQQERQGGGEAGAGLGGGVTVDGAGPSTFLRVHVRST